LDREKLAPGQSTRLHGEISSGSTPGKILVNLEITYRSAESRQVLTAAVEADPVSIVNGESAFVDFGALAADTSFPVKRLRFSKGGSDLVWDHVEAGSPAFKTRIEKTSKDSFVVNLSPSPDFKHKIGRVRDVLRLDFYNQGKKVPEGDMQIPLLAQIINPEITLSTNTVFFGTLKSGSSKEVFVGLRSKDSSSLKILDIDYRSQNEKAPLDWEERRNGLIVRLKHDPKFKGQIAGTLVLQLKNESSGKQMEVHIPVLGFLKSADLPDT
jgi:hypothetical protein